MKRLILVLFVLFMFVGCSSGEKSSTTNVSNTNISENKTELENKKTFDADEVLKNVSIAEYKYDSWGFYYHFIELTNNSDSTINVELNILYYDKNNNLVSAESCSEDVIESGYSVLLYTMPDEDFDRTEIELTVAEPRYYEPVQSDIELSITPAKDKLVVQATNIGEKPADFVEVSALFFKGNEVVGHDWTYFTDDDSEIKPGKTISNNLEAYKDFDSYKCYVTGRR